ncbi:MAG: hypothetical protein U9P49_12660, partial [Thermodesulfobacteriota bacterium]|nr:hypothetical protein [Thermodesulfobacteriota bacterium]
MALTSVITQIQHRIGLSTDAKPEGMTPGSTIYEYDTGRIMITYDGDNWEEKYGPGVPIMGFRASDSTYQPIRLCKCYNSLIVTDEACVKVSAGDDFYYHDVLEPLAGEASQDYLLTMPDSDVVSYFDLD